MYWIRGSISLERWGTNRDGIWPAGVGEVALAAAVVRATAAAHRVDFADSDFFDAACACDRAWAAEPGTPASQIF